MNANTKSSYDIWSGLTQKLTVELKTQRMAGLEGFDQSLVI